MIGLSYDAQGGLANKNVLGRIDIQPLLYKLGNYPTLGRR